jgi:hypothetical protein
MSPDEDLTRRVIDAVKAEGLAPSDVVRRLKEAAPEDSVRNAIWRLIDRGVLEFTREGLVRMAT